MPQLRDITVRVTDTEGNEFEEWAVQYLRNQHKVSAYIKARSNLPFRVTVQAKIPYTDYELPYETAEPLYDFNSYQDHSDETRARDRRSGKAKVSGSQRARSGYHSQSLYDGNRRKTSTHTQSSSVRTRHHYPKAPPFDLLASLYLDGRRTAERRVIVYLDPDHEDFTPGGKSCLKSRWVQMKGGGIKEHAWVFNDIGIDTILDKLALSSPSQDAGDEEIAIVAAMKRAGISPENDMHKEERKRVGQIEVRVSRVVLRTKYTVDQYQSRHQEGEEEDIEMNGADADLTHTTGLAPKKYTTSNSVPIVEYSLYDEETYATFKFFYRSQETLEKLIPSYPRISRPSRQSKRIDTVFSAKTPLSISQGLKLKHKQANLDGAAFEDRFKQQTFESRTKVKYNFDDRNRRVEQDAPKDEPSANAGESKQSLNADPASQATLTARTDQRNNEKGEKETANADGFETSLVPKASSAVFDEPRPSMKSAIQRHAPSSEDDTGGATALSTRRLSRATLDSDNSRLAAKLPYRLWGGSTEASAEISDCTASPKSPAKTLFDTQKYSPLTGERVLDNVASITNELEQSTKLASVEFRHEFSSDADDEHDIDQSDIETEMGEEDRDPDNDMLPSQDKDDEGLHKHMREITIKGKGKRFYDADGSLEEGDVDEGEFHTSLHEQSSINDAGDELQQAESKQRNKSMKTAGQEPKDSEQQNKRMKKYT